MLVGTKISQESSNSEVISKYEEESGLPRCIEVIKTLESNSEIQGNKKHAQWCHSKNRLYGDKYVYSLSQTCVDTCFRGSALVCDL